LRWRLFVNSLRRRNRGIELGLQALSLVFAGTFVFITCVGFFAGTLGLLKIERSDLLDLLLWGIFVIWQLAPILFEGYSPGLNFREVARYPVSFRIYFLLNSVYGLADPAAVTCMLWLFSMWMGIVVQRLEWALPAALAMLLFALFNLFLNRIVIGLFERFQSTRKGRERMVLLFLVIMMLPSLLQFATGNFKRMPLNMPAWAPSIITPVRAMSPPGITLQIFEFTGSAELWAIAGLCLYCGLMFFLLRHQMLSVYQGEIYSEGHTLRGEMKVHPGWHIPGLDEITSTIVEKELRYIRQSSRLLLQLLYPLIFFFLMALNGPVRKAAFAGKPENVLAGVAGFLLLSAPNMAYNNFGVDKEGFGRWLLSPLPLRKVFLGKNLTSGGLLALIYLAVAGIIILTTHVRFVFFITITLAFLAGLMIQLSAGNLFSVYWPKRIELTQMNSKMASNAAGFASLLVMLPLTAIEGFIWFVAWYWQLQWLPLLLAALILIASVKLHDYSLSRAASYAFNHLEEITGNLGA